VRMPSEAVSVARNCDLTGVTVTVAAPGPVQFTT